MTALAVQQVYRYPFASHLAAEADSRTLRLATFTSDSTASPYFFHGGTLRWVATIWPIARESYFAMGSFSIGHNLKSWQAAWHFRTFLEPLLDPDTPLREMGLFLLFRRLAQIICHPAHR